MRTRRVLVEDVTHPPTGPSNYTATFSHAVLPGVPPSGLCDFVFDGTCSRLVAPGLTRLSFKKLLELEDHAFDITCPRAPLSAAQKRNAREGTAAK